MFLLFVTLLLLSYCFVAPNIVSVISCDASKLLNVDFESHLSDVLHNLTVYVSSLVH
jgi:hypothetical protein